MQKSLGTLSILLLFMVFVALGCQTGSSSKTTSANPIASESLYTKFNLHVQQKINTITASYANWTGPFTGHSIIPYNTKVEVGKWGRGFKLHCVKSGKTVLFEYHARRMDMSVQEYIDVITSETPVGYYGLSKIDKKGIKDGQAYKGMTKKGVKVALGYPATHKTPSLNSNKWVYWTNRFGTIAVSFNSSGKVVQVIN